MLGIFRSKSGQDVPQILRQQKLPEISEYDKPRIYSQDTVFSTIGKNVHIISSQGHVIIDTVSDNVIIEMGYEIFEKQGDEFDKFDDSVECNTHLSFKHSMNKYKLLITGNVGVNVLIVCHKACDIEIQGSIGTGIKINNKLGGNLMMQNSGEDAIIYTKGGDISCERTSPSAKLITEHGKIFSVNSGKLTMQEGPAVSSQELSLILDKLNEKKLTFPQPKTPDKPMTATIKKAGSSIFPSFASFTSFTSNKPLNDVPTTLSPPKATRKSL